MRSILQHDCQKTGQLTEEALETRLICSGRATENCGTFYSFREEEIGELRAKSMLRTARIQLAGRHLLFGEYLQN